MITVLLNSIFVLSAIWGIGYGVTITLQDYIRINKVEKEPEAKEPEVKPKKRKKVLVKAYYRYA